MTAPWLRPGWLRWMDDLPAPRMPRIRKRGTHHAGQLRIDFGGTVPRAKVDGRPPWHTAPMPKAGEAS